MKQLAALVLITFFSTSTWAGLLDDDEARKAILDLRAEVRRSDADHAQKIQLLNDQMSSLGIASANSMAKLRSDLTE